MQGARIERIGEGIKITFDSGLLFDVNKSDLRPQAKTNIESLANILNKYSDTNILVEGDTDNTGTEEYNLTVIRTSCSICRQLSNGSGRSRLKDFHGRSG